MPSRAGYTCAPASRTFSNIITDTLTKDYTATNTFTNSVYLPV